MRSKLLIGALCVAALMLVAPAAHAQVETGKIAKEVSKTWEFTTDTSTIFQIEVIAFDENTDIDILVTVPDGDDDDTERDVVVDSKSALSQIEQATVGLLGAQDDVRVTITNADGRFTRFALRITQPALDADNARFGAAPMQPALGYVGEFRQGDELADPEMASIQRLVRERLAAKAR